MASRTAEPLAGERARRGRAARSRRPPTGARTPWSAVRRRATGCDADGGAAAVAELRARARAANGIRRRPRPRRRRRIRSSSARSSGAAQFGQGLAVVAEDMRPKLTTDAGLRTATWCRDRARYRGALLRVLAARLRDLLDGLFGLLVVASPRARCRPGRRCRRARRGRRRSGCGGPARGPSAP